MPKFIGDWIQAFELFWCKAPALLYALFFYFGILAAITTSWCWLIPAAMLIWPLCFWKNRSSSLYLRLLLSLGIFLGAYFSVSNRVVFPPESCDYLQGSAVIEVEDVTQGIRFGTPFWKYRLSIVLFVPHNSNITIKNIPCDMTWKDFTTRPHAGFCYELEGTLKKVKDSKYVFSPAKSASFTQKKSRFSLVELRVKAKMFFKKFVRRYLPPTEARTFLEGLLSGDFHDQFLANNLRRFGLTHIMVVSGFHFSLLAAFIGFLLKGIAPRKPAIFGLLLAATLYLLFIGAAPSVMRAWVAIACVLLAKLTERKTGGLNALGVGLLVVLCYDPTYCMSLGFQLSFLATGAILLFYSLCDRFLLRLFPVRSVSFVSQLPICDQVIYFLLVFFRKTWALSIAVQFLMLPMCLYAFQSVPLLGIVYNSFFPFLVSICMVLFVLGCLFCWLPYICGPIFQTCHSITDFSLTFVNYLPEVFDINIKIENITDWQLSLYLSIVCFMAIVFLSRKSDAQFLTDSL